MSAQWRTASGEYAGTAWASKNGPAMDWGAKGRADQMMAAAMAGESFESDEGATMTGSQFMAFAMGEDQYTEDGKKWSSGRKTWTFGEFGGTFEIGTGDMATWMGM